MKIYYYEGVEEITDKKLTHTFRSIILVTGILSGPIFRFLCIPLKSLKQLTIILPN
jgi:hypothetical protein